MIFVVVAIIALPLLWALITYNSLIALTNRSKTAFSSIDVQLKKRHDLIPQLVSTVKGYMQHERAVLERVTELRDQARAVSDPTKRAGIERDIGGCIGAIQMRAEAYPDLKAGENFLMLQRSLNEVEEQISAARRAYNAAVENFNNKVQMFPSSIIAGMMNKSPMEFFEAVESERAPVPVDLETS